MVGANDTIFFAAVTVVPEYRYHGIYSKHRGFFQREDLLDQEDHGIGR